MPERLKSISEKQISTWPLAMEDRGTEIMLVTALHAGNMLTRAFYSTFESRVKEDQSEFTPFDIQAERIARRGIKQFDPAAVFMGEELSPNEDVSGKNFWTIDGIDGTTNFSRGIPIWNFTMAYVERGRTKLGIVYVPLNNEMFYAAEGQGAYLNGKPIHIKERPYTESVITFAPLLDVRQGKGEFEAAEVEALWKGMEEITKGSRRFHREFQSGGQELAWVASGRLDGYASSWTNPWDLSAGALLVRAAGGIATNILGEEWQPSYWGVIVGSQTVHPELLKVLKQLFLEAQKSQVIQK